MYILKQYYLKFNAVLKKYATLLDSVNRKMPQIFEGGLSGILMTDLSKAFDWIYNTSY